MLVRSLWKCVSPRVSWCRSFPIPPTPLSYNFSDTALVPFLSAGLCTRPFCTSVFDASRRKAKEGTKQHVLSLCSIPPSGPYPYLTFCIDFVPLLSCLTFFSLCLHTNQGLACPPFFRDDRKLRPRRGRVKASRNRGLRWLRARANSRQRLTSMAQKRSGE